MIAGAVGAAVRAVLRAGRAVAGEHQLRVATTAALIGMAQTRGLIPLRPQRLRGAVAVRFPHFRRAYPFEQCMKIAGMGKCAVKR